MWTIILTLIMAGAGAYLGTYLREKAKNLATQEDTKKITRAVEEVRAEFARERDRASQVHTMRMAALERRLQAHQEAYALWRELFGNVHGPDIGKAVLKCQDWWDRNCLYLDEGARGAFRAAYGAAAGHADLVQMQPRNEEAIRLISGNMEAIRAAGPALVKAAALPPLADETLSVK